METTAPALLDQHHPEEKENSARNKREMFGASRQPTLPRKLTFGQSDQPLFVEECEDTHDGIVEDDIAEEPPLTPIPNDGSERVQIGSTDNLLHLDLTKTSEEPSVTNAPKSAPAPVSKPTEESSKVSTFQFTHTEK